MTAALIIAPLFVCKPFAAEAAVNPHYWAELCWGLVAHAGGCADFVELGGNSREAMELSYKSGHRVFEFDFNITTDGKLAAVHDWIHYKGAMSAADWANVKVYGNLTSMMYTDILDFMLAHKDMYIITDTKSYDMTAKDVAEQFRLIVEAAKAKDPTLGLINRIVPQIYNRPMYDIVTKQYKFPSVIYTLYQSHDTDKQVLDFVKSHNDIKAVTMLPWKANKQFVKDLNAAGKYIYLHAINDLGEMKAYKAAGIHGFYTDFAYPSETGIKLHAAPELRVNDSPAFVNGEPVPSITIGGEVFVFTADLTNYGFKTAYDDKTRQLTVTYDKNKKTTPITKSKALSGGGVFEWVYTDIRAVINGAIIEKSYHINGYIAVPLKAVGG